MTATRTRARVWAPSRATSLEWLPRGAAIVIVLVAAGLRLWQLDLTVFEIDEAALVRLAEDMVRLGRVPLSGPVFSAGVPSAPHFIYLLAPILALSRDPAFVAGAIAVANVLGLVGALWLGWRTFGQGAAVTAGALYAVSPWAVVYSRWIWQPDVLPPMAVLLFVALDLAVVDRRAWWAAATFVIVALGALIHPSFATLVPLLLAPAAILIRMRRWLPLVIGIGAACLSPLPYVLYQVQTHWVDVASIRYYSTLHTWVDFDALGYAVLLDTGWAAPNDPAVPPILIQLGVALEGGLLLAAIALGLLVVWRRRWPTEPFLRLRLGGLGLWLVLPVALTLRHTLPLQAHYYLAAYPAPFLLIGAMLAWLFRQRGMVARVGRICGVAALAATVLIQGSLVIRNLESVAANSGPCNGALLRTAKATEHEIVDLGGRSASTRAAVELKANDSVPLGYLLRSHYPAVDLAGAGDIGLGPQQPTEGSWAAPEGVVPALTVTQEHDLRFASGIRLVNVGFSDRPQPDEPVVLAISWLVQDDAVSNHPFVWDVALVESGGRIAFEKSGVDHVPAQLQGQHVVSWMRLDPTQDGKPVPEPGTYGLRLQLVDTWVPQVVEFVDGQSQQTDAALNLGPISIAAPVACRSFTG